MTRQTFDLMKSISDKQMVFNIDQTIRLLKSYSFKYWSWGVNKLGRIESKGLILKVNGHHHKGYVLITLSFDDTYKVDIVSTHGNLLDTYETIYCDELFDRIDERIEKIPEYKR